MQNIDWTQLGFGYTETPFNVRCYCKRGTWGNLEVSESEHINIHMAATCLHYGQEAFEGLKAFKGKDGKIRIFRVEENAKRMINSAKGILMEEPSVELFVEAVTKAVQLNSSFVPPYGSGASLYIRPLLIGTGAQVGVKPADEYLFMVFVTPVGPYFKTGFKPSKMVVTREFDRAAPQGTGNIKVGGNYAASMRSGRIAQEGGYSAVLYLDSKEKKYIDECGPANFFGIKDNTYITPLSDSILPSITNKSLIQIAKDIGLHVERRQVSVNELASFEEVGACGTAAVISPIAQIDDADTGDSFIYSRDGKPGEYSEKLYHTLLGIQTGDLPDPYHWNTIIE